ncbi:MAG TPA: hypothetical protein VFL93_08270 [Longimicrobiaceae bacterium]|nr:hypothetical protein [Longimicrobiaceae bacterium]
MLTIHRSSALAALALTLALFAAPAPAHAQFGRLMKRAAKAAAVNAATEKVKETTGVSSSGREAPVTDESLSKLIVQRRTELSEAKRLMEQDPKYRQAEALRQARDACGPQILKADRQQAALDNQLVELLRSSASEDEKMEKGSKLRVQMQQVARPACEATTRQTTLSSSVDYTPPNMDAIRKQAYEAGLQKSGLSDGEAASLFEQMIFYFFRDPGGRPKIAAAEAHRDELVPLLDETPEFDFLNPEITADVLASMLSVTPKLQALPSNDEQQACMQKMRMAGGESAQAMQEHFVAELKAAQAAGDYARMQVIADSVRKAMEGNALQHMKYTEEGGGAPKVGVVTRVEIAATQQCGPDRQIAYRDLILTAGLEPEQYDHVRARLRQFAGLTGSADFKAREVYSGYTPAESALLKAHAAEIVKLFGS